MCGAMKVLWITGRYFGIDLCQTTQVELASALKKCGHEISFLAPTNEYGITLIQQEELKIHPVKISKIRGLKSFSFDKQVKKLLPQIIEKNGIEIVICSWRGIMGAAKTLKSSQIPWFLIDRGPPVNSGILSKLQWKYYDRAFKKYAPSAEKVFTVSDIHANFVQSRFSLVNKPLVISAGVNPEKFELTHIKKSEPPGLIYHGSLDSFRNVLSLVDVGDLLAERNVIFKMTLIGEGNLFKKLIELTETREWLNVSPKVSRDKIVEILLMNHIGMLPMNKEMGEKFFSSPLKMYEYGAAELAMVGIEHAGHRLEGGEAFQRLVPEEGIVQKMALEIEKLLSEDLERIGKLAKKYVLENYSWDRSARVINMAIEGLNSK